MKMILSAEAPGNGVAGRRASDNGPMPVGGRTKRAMDVCIALTALLLLAPLLIGVWLLVIATSRGPALYGHERIGHNGRRFRCLKFRSMVVDGEAVLQKHLSCNGAAAAEWAETRKLRNDPRITRIGRVLRQTSVDELPQLFNVLAGDMSIVGPRPVVEDELERYRNAKRYYLRARPGITGLWQVSGRSDTTYRRRVLLDRQYVSGWKLSRDLDIIFRTVPVVLKKTGSY